VEPDRRTLRHGLATEREELLHQLFGAFARGEHLTEVVPGGTGLWHIVGCKFSKAQDHGQEIIEIVGDAASQRSDGLDFLSLAEVVFESPRLRHIAKGDHHPLQDAVAAANGGSTPGDGPRLALAVHQHGRRLEIDPVPGLEHALHRSLDRLLGLGMGQAEDCINVEANGFLSRPARQRCCDWVHKGHRSRRVCRYNRICNAR
jgi:hypothetical protein